MKFVVNANEMKQIDDFTINDIGIPSVVLMERAALSVVHHMVSNILKTDRILSVCGSGNNGGDGIAAARLLHQLGYQVDVLLLKDEASCKVEVVEQIKIAKNLGVNFYNNINIHEYTIIIDAILGIGINKPVLGIYENIINIINKGNHTVFSIDIPSGLSSDTGKPMNIAVKANYTITFGLVKVGLLVYPGIDYAGKIIVADIGFPKIALEKITPKAFTYELEDIKLLPKREDYSNKGSFGKALVIAGSDNMTGASYLSAKACYRMGSGLVKVMSSKECVNAVRYQLPEAIYTTLNYSNWDNDNSLKVIKELTWANVVVFGPGIGINLVTEQMLEILIDECKIPIILDADAIGILAKRLNERNIDNYLNRIEYLAKVLPKGTVLTPHLKELERLLNLPVSYITEHFIEIARDCSRNDSIIFILKDAKTVVAYNGNLYINNSGNNGMATAGSGDVLTGIIAGLIATGLSPIKSATLGVYIHGLAGDIGALSISKYSLMASDIIDHLPKVLMIE